MSQDTLSPEIMQSLKVEIKSAILEILPDMIKQLAPIFIDMMKEISPVIVNSTREHASHIYALSQDAEEKKKQHGKMYQEFIKNHDKEFGGLMEQKKKYYQRCVALNWHLELYEEYLTNGESYIPKEYRKDDYYVHDEEELSSVVKFEEQRLRSECEILAKRKRFMLDKMGEIDQKVLSVIDGNNRPEEVKEMATKRWFDFTKECMKPIEAEEEKKKRSTIESHNKDKLFYKKHQVERLKNRKAQNYPEFKLNTRRGSAPSTTALSAANPIHGHSEKKDNRREGAPTVPSNNHTLVQSSGFESVGIQGPVDPKKGENIVNMSILESLEVPENLEQQQKKLGWRGTEKVCTNIVNISYDNLT